MRYRLLMLTMKHCTFFTKKTAASPIRSDRRHRQHGLARPVVLSLVVAIAGAGAGGWWWWSQRATSPSTAEAGVNGTPGAGPATPASGAASGAGGANARRFGGANRVQPVSVAAVRKQDVRVVLNAIGNISALNTATVRARVDGELKSIRFKEGQMVRAGAVLAEIDPRSFEIALAQVQGQLAKDQALLKNAQVDVERYKDLLAKDSIAKQQVDTQIALVQQLSATVQTTQAQVDNAKLQLSYTKITAPISGRLGLKTAELGNLVRAGDATGIVTITQTQPISVVFALPEANLPQITRKLKGTEPLTVQAWDRDLRNQLADGKVSTTDNAIDAVTGTIKVKAEFANTDGALFPNQFVNIKLQVNTLTDAVAIPSTAVQRTAQGTFVYVVKPDSNVTIRRIRLGTTEGDWVSVQGDLAEGEKVVTDGADRLREGAKVEVIVAPAPRGGPGGGGGAGALGQPDAPVRTASGTKPNRPPAAPTDGPAAAPAPSEATAATPRTPAPITAPPTAPPPAPTAAGAGSAAWIDQLPPEAQERVRRTLERIGPEAAAKVHKMTPDERRAFFQQLRAQREQQQQNQ
jgi:membrane fusion protein, multidrug efflux system